MHVHRFFIAALATSLAMLALGRAAVAVEYGNLMIDPLNPPYYSTWPGEATSGFYVDAAASSTGSYAIRIGADYADDRSLGLLIPSVAKNYLDLGVPVHATNVSVGADGRYTIKTRVAQTNLASDVDVSAAYFPFAENWTMGYTYRADGTLTTQMDSLTANGGLQMNVDVYDDTFGGTQIWLPGVNSITDGVLLAANLGGAGNTDAVALNYAMVQANDDGSFHVFSHADNTQGTTYAMNPVGFVFIPHGTTGAITGVGTSAAGIVAGSGFRLDTTENNTVLLTIDGYAPNQGTLVINQMGGRNSTDDNILSYEIVGNSFEIHMRDLTGVADEVPALEASTNGRRNFSFAFLPFDTHATGPGTIQPASRPQGPSLGRQHPGDRVRRGEELLQGHVVRGGPVDRGRHYGQHEQGRQFHRHRRESFPLRGRRRAGHRPPELPRQFRHRRRLGRGDRQPLRHRRRRRRRLGLGGLHHGGRQRRRRRNERPLRHQLLPVQTGLGGRQRRSDRKRNGPGRPRRQDRRRR